MTRFSIFLDFELIGIFYLSQAWRLTAKSLCSYVVYLLIVFVNSIHQHNKQNTILCPGILSHQDDPHLHSWWRCSLKLTSSFSSGEKRTLKLALKFLWWGLHWRPARTCTLTFRGYISNSSVLTLNYWLAFVYTCEKAQYCNFCQ